MADNDLKVIVKAKDLAVHSFKLTSNCNRYPKKYRHSLVDRIQVKSLDIYETLLEANRINGQKGKRNNLMIPLGGWGTAAPHPRKWASSLSFIPF